MYNSILIALRGSGGTGKARIVAANGLAEIDVTLRQQWPGSACRAYIVSQTGETALELNVSGLSLKGSCAYNGVVNALLLCLPHDMKFLLEGTASAGNTLKSLESIKERLRITNISAASPKKSVEQIDSSPGSKVVYDEPGAEIENDMSLLPKTDNDSSDLNSNVIPEANYNIHDLNAVQHITIDAASKAPAYKDSSTAATNYEPLILKGEAARFESAPDLTEAKNDSAALKRILEHARSIFPEATSDFDPQAAVSGSQAALLKRDSKPNIDTPMKKAGDNWDKQVDDMLSGNPRAASESKKTAGIAQDLPIYNPFPDAYPRSNWKRKFYPGTNRFYLEGEALKDNMRLLIHALPGEYSPVPPMRNRGFTKFMRSTDGSGYWLRIQRKN